MTILEQLHTEHEEAAELFKTIEDTTERAVKSRQENFEKLRKDLSVHIGAEEHVLYDALRGVKDAKFQVLESLEEHKVARDLLEQLANMPVNDERWLPKLVVLRENIDHHVKEEESDVFKLAKKHFSEEQLEEMCDDYLLQKEKLMDGETGNIEGKYSSPDASQTRT